MRTKELGPEVYYIEDEVVAVRRADIEGLKKKAGASLRGKARFCCHKSPQDKIHEMLIVHKKGAYVRPHKHLNKSEAFHVISGSADVFLFDDSGKLFRVIRLGDFGSGGVFYYRIDASYYHSLSIYSDEFIFHEIKDGPFDPADSLFASWAPAEGDIAASSAFMQKTEKEAAKLKRQE